MRSTSNIQCACGQVLLEVQGTPIASAECHCDSCRKAGAQFQTLPAVPNFLEPNGGTRLILYRKDRVRFLHGTEQLSEFRLAPVSKTRRVVAACCNTPVFLELHNGHWLSLYACLWPEQDRPAPTLRTMTSDLTSTDSLPNDIPNCKRQNARFIARLLGAWIAMGFRSPKIEIDGTLELPENG